MSMMRQVWLLVLLVVIGGCLGGIGVSVQQAREYIETQVSVKNNDNAQSLALTLSQLKGDASLLELGVSAQFDTGHYERIVLTGPDGRVLVDRSSPPQVMRAPAWFQQALPLQPKPGVAQVSSGWTQLGRLEVRSHTAFAYEDLWTGSVRMALWMLALGGVTAVLGLWAVHRLRRPLDAVVAQAQALSERQFILMEEPQVPEMKRVARALNVMVERLRALFGEQVREVEALRRQVHCDELTGLTHRRQFLADFQSELEDETGPGRGHLVLLRLLDLAGVNRRLGHVQTDALLRELADVLRHPVEGVRQRAVGRLNGSDFAVFRSMPVGGEAFAQDILDRVRSTLEPYGDVVLVASVAAWSRGDQTGALLARADAALARAEASGEVAAVALADRGGASAAGLGGEDAWRRQLESAVLEQRARLVKYPVIDPRGGLLHMECPLRLQLHDGGEFEPAAHWLPYAMRTQLTTRTDEVALSLALQGIAQDREPRCVHVSLQSMRDAAFLPRIRARIAAAGVAAQSLWIEVSASAVDLQAAVLGEMVRQLRPLGVRIGVEHAGVDLPTSGGLLDVGLDYVKLAGSVGVDVSRDRDRALLVERTVRLLHSLDLKVYAEGVADASDLKVLWTCGVDGATGPAVKVTQA